MQLQYNCKFGVIFAALIALKEASYFMRFHPKAENFKMIVVGANNFTGC